MLSPVGTSYDSQAAALSPVQAYGGGADMAGVHAAAARGVSGGGSALPHLGEIQQSFGRHDVSGVHAHVGGGAAGACADIGASAYATGNNVAFEGPPSLHTAAHEAAHVVQQRAGVQLLGGVGQVGDRYETHADEVADAVVQGKSAEPILDRMAGSPIAGGAPAGAGVQRNEVDDELGEVNEEHRKKGYIDGAGALYQDILTAQSLATDKVYQAEKEQPKPTWDEALIKRAVGRALELAVKPLDAVGAGLVNDAVKGVGGIMKGAVQGGLEKLISEKLGPNLPSKNPALAFFIPLKETLADTKVEAQQAFYTKAKPLLSANGTLADAKEVQADMLAAFKVARATFDRDVVDQWLLYVAGAVHGQDASGDTRLADSGSDMEGGALGHGPTGVLFVRGALDGDEWSLGDPPIKVVSFDIFGVGADMWELIIGQNRKVEDFEVDMKIFGPAGTYSYYMGNSGRVMTDRNAYYRVGKNPGGSVWDMSDEAGQAWLELLGYGEAGKVSEAYKTGSFKVDRAKRDEGTRKLFTKIQSEPVDKNRLIKR